MLHYAFLLELMVFGVSSAGFAQSINVTDAEAEQAPQTKIAAAKANEDIAKIDDVSTLLRGVLAFKTAPPGAGGPTWDGDPATLQLSPEQVAALTLARGQMPEVQRWLQTHGPRGVRDGGSAESSRRQSLLDRPDERCVGSMGSEGGGLAASTSEGASHGAQSDQEELGSIVAEVKQKQELLSRLRESITAKR